MSSSVSRSGGCLHGACEIFEAMVASGTSIKYVPGDVERVEDVVVVATLWIADLHDDLPEATVMVAINQGRRLP